MYLHEKYIVYTHTGFSYMPYCSNTGVREIHETVDYQMFSISVKGLVLPLVTWGETTYMGESINLKIRYLN